MKCLLLNSYYQPINIIHERKAINLLVRGKINIIHSWDNKSYTTINNTYDMPAVAQLTYNIRHFVPKIKFSFKRVMERDGFKCCYCDWAPYQNDIKKLEIDHVVPRSSGGTNSWSNCVTCCGPCNRKKGSLSVEKAGMTLLKKPMPPRSIIQLMASYLEFDSSHPTWHDYLKTA